MFTVSSDNQYSFKSLLRSKNLYLQLFDDTIMFVIRRDELHPIRRSCRSDEGIGEFHAVAQKILFDIKKCFGGDFFAHVDRFGIPLSQCLLKTSQFLFV